MGRETRAGSGAPATDASSGAREAESVCNRRRARRDVVSLETRIKPATRTETRTIASGAGKGGDEKDVAGNGGDEKDVAGTTTLTLVAASSDGTVAEFEILTENASETPRDERGVGFTWNAGFFASAEPDATPSRTRNIAATGR